ncbi:hypothetical protein B0T24DRAFT_712188 [Lasiosphaeria ovina]|uniref:Protein HGH1 N-terminal domain-containing protein n=1 Tax=Lasiosphaeria ovina TaxID=92902 RepID=A0AAE0JV68_9PEZI|nr:hypothetical protein B0T24DRAFT_712188 [Lasiosphaeria ovina]
MVASRRRISLTGTSSREVEPSRTGGIVFDLWLHLSKDVSTTTVDVVAERTVAEWRNYSGFLASLGGICIADQASVLNKPAVSELRWIDRLSSKNHEETFLSRYLRLSIQLLACANVRIRETMREVLSTEPSVKGQDNDIVFAEQSASLLKALVESLDTPSDLGAASSLHLGALTLNFTKFLDGVPNAPSSLRVKIKIYQLYEAVTKRKEHLNLRDDVRNRNQLLECIFSWIARPQSPRNDGAVFAGGRQDETTRVQRDLDKACLRSLAELTFRLPLQPGEGQTTDAGTSELKSQMFHQYFNRFLSLLNLGLFGPGLGPPQPSLRPPRPSARPGRPSSRPNPQLIPETPWISAEEKMHRVVAVPGRYLAVIGQLHPDATFVIVRDPSHRNEAATPSQVPASACAIVIFVVVVFVVVAAAVLDKQPRFEYVEQRERVSLGTRNRNPFQNLGSNDLVLNQLVDLFVKGMDGSYNNKPADFDYLAYLFADLAKHREIRTLLCNQAELQVPPLSAVGL